jgi:capsular polysaccharide biosynthesis protein
MELRTLLKILKRYWYLIIIPPILVGLFTLITYRAPAPSYAATLRFSVGYVPEQQTTSLYDRKYPAWLTSEYIAGGLSDWAKTGDFAQAVASVAGGDLTAGEVAGSLVSDHLRSIVVLYLNGGDPDRLAAIGDAAIKVLQLRNNVVFPQNGEGATVTALDGVAVAPAPPSLRNRLDIPIRLGLGLALGVVLALLVWYFDPRIRDRADAEAIGLDILAEIPKK